MSNALDHTDVLYAVARKVLTHCVLPNVAWPWALCSAAQRAEPKASMLLFQFFVRVVCACACTQVRECVCARARARECVCACVYSEYILIYLFVL